MVNLRDFGEGSHKVVDDKLYGGGVGMLLKVNVLAKALKTVTRKRRSSSKCQIILTSASGNPYKQSDAQKLSKLDHLVIVCGHYEGVDQRFIEKFVDQEISIGDYVLTGGEIPALVIVDSVVRLISGVLKDQATIDESFTNPNLLEYPQYTRPDKFEGAKVPPVLLSGNHAEISKWRKERAIKKTRQVRPDLID